MVHVCDVCQAEFPSAHARNGHKGGKHSDRKIHRDPIRHCTAVGWRAHQRRGTEPCQCCRTAWAQYIRDYRGRRRNAGDRQA